ncbi:hypothetical protein KFK09_007842 [Dendrobium nobile]|uniref:Uncharacterized protein n=1 Tax=Dendrobium nobile TaxID=94219 RepID=A0A8T3BV80_DENNO|nr:hypothetical protein KFK09_007842 [Dendrobium nobile]
MVLTCGKGSFLHLSRMIVRRRLKPEVVCLRKSENPSQRKSDFFGNPKRGNQNFRF